MVKINGGSQLVDLQEIDLSTETGQTKTGLYADLANAYKDNKLMIGFNALNDGKVVSPLPMIVFAASDTEIHCLFSVYQIAITNEDVATVSNIGGNA